MRRILTITLLIGVIFCFSIALAEREQKLFFVKLKAERETVKKKGEAIEKEINHSTVMILIPASSQAEVALSVADISLKTYPDKEGWKNRKIIISLVPDEIMNQVTRCKKNGGIPITTME